MADKRPRSQPSRKKFLYRPPWLSSSLEPGISWIGQHAVHIAAALALAFISWCSASWQLRHKAMRFKGSVASAGAGAIWLAVMHVAVTACQRGVAALALVVSVKQRLLACLPAPSSWC